MDVMQRAGELSRRELGALGVGASVIALLPRAANAAEVSESEVTIKTPDGNCDAHFVHPKTARVPPCWCGPTSSACAILSGRWASAWPRTGYSVLTVNPFYRTQKAPTAPPIPTSAIRPRAKR